MAEERKKGLGRGLSALLGDNAATAVAAVSTAVASGMEAAPASIGLRSIPVEWLQPGRFQPRRHFDEDHIADLVESIRDKGILQPLLVRPLPDHPGRFEIIAGERRWRAAQRARLHEVPAIVSELSDREALEVALVENLQRQDLSALEEADGYRRLMEEFSHTQEELAKAVGKSRSHVANMLRLLALPEPVRILLEKGELTAGHARALLTADDPVGLAHEVVSKGLNVRQTEKLVASQGKPKSSAKERPTEDGKDADIVALERDLTEMLGCRVAMKPLGKGGELTIAYGSLEQLDDLLSRLAHRPEKKHRSDIESESFLG
ncbi:ParB/RepB/Spo0J family partition protein [Magnetospirillum molischianum]|uniref:Chromosome partitioning protein n=1 Tax=Magnetospirillum molischianum DSM 120 TaxID=1150626 RepID=H8FTE1_MAGML|nr:ParB/RepB/Spo0J family partition protein [Magnetospirillum molischianum]CCG41629.1 chromosome partitioning protein [Magnetospirillum molischianum DSM 120]